jgi:hypothetical protein
MGILKFGVIYVLTVAISLPLLIMGSVWLAKGWQEHRWPRGAWDSPADPAPTIVITPRPRQGKTVVVDPLAEPSATPATKSPPTPKKPKAKRQTRKRPPKGREFKGARYCPWGYRSTCIGNQDPPPPGWDEEGRIFPD